MASRHPSVSSQLPPSNSHRPGNRRGMLLYGASYVFAAIFGSAIVSLLIYLGITWTP